MYRPVHVLFHTPYRSLLHSYGVFFSAFKPVGDSHVTVYSLARLNPETATRRCSFPPVLGHLALGPLWIVIGGFDIVLSCMLLTSCLLLIVFRHAHSSSFSQKSLYRFVPFQSMRTLRMAAAAKKPAIDRSPSTSNFDSGHADGPADGNAEEKLARTHKRQKSTRDRASTTLSRLNSTGVLGKRRKGALRGQAR